MKAATLIRRMSAEGIILGNIADAILTEGSKMKTGGSYGRDESLDMTIQEMAVSMSKQIRYVDGMLPGAYTELDGTRHPNRVYWTLKGGFEESDLVAYIAAATEALKKCTRVLQMSANGQNHDEWERNGDGFLHISGQCEGTRFSEENGLFLPDGIRARVATALGYNMESTTFHAAFDAAVAQLQFGDWGLE